MNPSVSARGDLAWPSISETTDGALSVGKAACPTAEFDMSLLVDAMGVETLRSPSEASSCRIRVTSWSCNAKNASTAPSTITDRTTSAVPSRVSRAVSRRRAPWRWYAPLTTQCGSPSVTAGPSSRRTVNLPSLSKRVDTVSAMPAPIHSSAGSPVMFMKTSTVTDAGTFASSPVWVVGTGRAAAAPTPAVPTKLMPHTTSPAPTHVTDTDLFTYCTSSTRKDL